MLALIYVSGDVGSTLTVGFPVRHLARDLLARHLPRDVSHGLLIKPLGLLLFFQPLPLHARPVPVAAGAIALGQIGPKEVDWDGEDDRGVLVDGDLSHSLKEPELQRRRALEPI